MGETLALTGGPPVWDGGWPTWPLGEDDDLESLGVVLRGGRWAISGESRGRTSLDVELARRFAEYTGARWCIPVDHGSSALLVGLHVVGVRPGDEVIVPGLTWVACASVVARMGAVPVLVDIDPDTQCLDPRAVEAAVSGRTTAMIVVHLYSAMAQMDELRRIADRHGVALIEDGAQAYGATWRGAKAGSLGDVGAFSAQQGKALTSGEGGLFVTSDQELRDRAEMLRGDGRRYALRHPLTGMPDLEECTLMQGWNMHLSEFQAALLLSGLERLDHQNAVRARAAALLDHELAAAGDLEPIRPYPANDGRAYYHYAIRLRPGAFSGRSAEQVCRALSAELGTWIHPAYTPLNRHPLFDPRRLPRVRGASGVDTDLDPSRFDLPVAERESARTVLLHHSLLLGSPNHLAGVCEAFDKVRRNAASIPLTE